MAEIDVVNQRIEDYTDVVEAIRAKVKQVAGNKNVSITGGTDTPLSILTKIDNGTIETPSETINITSNGIVDVTNYARADVSVEDAGFKSFVEGTMTTFRPADYGITKIINAPNNLITAMDLTGVAEIGSSTIDGYPIYSWDMTTLTLNSPNGLKIYKYGINYCVNVSSFTFNASTKITILGQSCFSNLGAERSNASSNRFVFDFRNSTFTSIPEDCFGTNESVGYPMKYNDMYFPSTLTSISAYAFSSMTYSNLFFKNIPTLSSISARGATTTKYFFPYNQAKSAKSATNWSNSNIVNYIYGWAEENTFSNGDTLPATDIGGNTLTWYSNPAMTSTYQVTTVSDATKIYYCKVV